MRQELSNYINKLDIDFTEAYSIILDKAKHDESMDINNHICWKADLTIGNLDSDYTIYIVTDTDFSYFILQMCDVLVAVDKV